MTREKAAEIAKRFDAQQRTLCAKFARGRITVQRGAWPTRNGFETRFYPRVAGRNVRPPLMPKRGYRTHALAMKGGEQFRSDCRKIGEALGMFPVKKTAEGGAER